MHSAFLSLQVCRQKMHSEGRLRHFTKLPTYLTLSSLNCTSICLSESWLISFSCFSLKALYSSFTADSSLSADCRTMRKSWTSLVNTEKKINVNKFHQKSLYIHTLPEEFPLIFGPHFLLKITHPVLYSYQNE